MELLKYCNTYRYGVYSLDVLIVLARVKEDWHGNK